MKHNKLKSVKQNMVETLELPKDLMYGDSIVTITGGREVLIENYKGILEYTGGIYQNPDEKRKTDRLWKKS